jgi:hypothetical protein
MYISVQGLAYAFPLIHEENDLWSFDMSQPYLRFIDVGNSEDGSCWVIDQQYGWATDTAILEELVECGNILPGLN